MPAAGDRIGSYVVVSLLGAGGMGEVFLAEDRRLNRRVALKVLPSSLATDDTARKRLLREAQSAATLDHPNICVVYEAGEADGRGFIAMQYIEGETLAARLARGPIPLDTTITIATQVAQALAEAHRQGIAHRDIKPQNVMIARSGQVKVLDFGLAKALAPVESDANTASLLTEAGTVTGTVPYMSPEQARGELIDERSDVFSFGTLLYEAVSGKHPFRRASAAETTSLILMREAPPLETTLPSELRRIIQKCLEKDRERRYQTARDLRIDLEAITRTTTAGVAVSPRRRLALLAASVLVFAAAAFFGWWFTQGMSPPPAASNFEQVTAFADAVSAPALSPDGRMVAFIRDPDSFLVRGDVYVKLLPNGEALRLTNDPQPKCCLAFSPDGSRIAYSVFDAAAVASKFSTWIVPVLGNQVPVKLLPNAAGLTWIDERQVLFSEIKGGGMHMGLVTATETRQARREIYFPEHERAMVHYSALSPNRQSVLIVEMNRTGGWDRCRLLPFDGSSIGHQVGPDGPCRSVAWSPDGRWMYFSSTIGGTSHLWRQRFPDGVATPLTSGPATDEQGVTVSPEGSIVTSVGRRSTGLWRHDGQNDRLLTSEGIVSTPRVSPDGKRVYFLLQRDAASSKFELARLDLETGSTERLLRDFSIVQYHVAPDERDVAFTTADREGEGQIWIASLDRTSAPRRLRESSNGVYFGAGQQLVFRSLEGRANFLERMNRDGTGHARISNSPIAQLNGISPDGQWVIAQVSAGIGGSWEAVAIPVYGGPVQRLCSGSCSAAWSADNRTLGIIVFTGSSSNETLLLPLAPGQIFPPFPTDGSVAMAVWANLPGVRKMDRAVSVPGSDGAYVFTKSDDVRNLFRIPVR